MAQCMLTTVDNPYNPFTQFDEWKAFDECKGYFTCEYLARIVDTSYDLSDEENDEQIESAINEAIYFNLLGIYQKVTPENFTSMKERNFTEENKESLKLLDGEESIDSSEQTIEEVL